MAGRQRARRDNPATISCREFNVNADVLTEKGRGEGGGGGEGLRVISKFNKKTRPTRRRA